ncbi:hypothetical protein F4680DRAFT_402427 [Xylaria scruposa]|nr:hypothetical protein F4680DRAFT_402427 [Xylaria scruposa]
MVVECDWSVRWLDKPAPYILRWYGRGCDDVYINVALHSDADKEPQSILFLKKGGPFNVPSPELPLRPDSQLTSTPEPTFDGPSHRPAPDAPPRTDDSRQRRVLEEQGKWHLPGGICRDKDRSIFDWLWTDIQAKLYVLRSLFSLSFLQRLISSRGLSIIEITALIHCSVAVVDNENGEGEKMILCLTVGARHVRDSPTVAYTVHGFSDHRWIGEKVFNDEEFPMRNSAGLRRHLRCHLMRLATSRGSRRTPRLPMFASMPGLFPKFR